MFLPLFVGSILFIFFAISAVVLFFYLIINLSTQEIFRNYFIQIGLIIIVTINLCCFFCGSFTWGLYSHLSQNEIKIIPSAIHQEKSLLFYGFSALYHGFSILFFLLIIELLLGWNVWKSILYSKEKLNVTTFSEKMNLNMK